jgi:hypothetical protein
MRMKRVAIASILVLALALPLFAAEQTWQNVPVVDKMCLNKVKADPDQHERTCLIQCAKTGFVIIAPDGKTLALDETGNAKVLDLVKNSDKKDHIRLDVTGELQGDTIKVASVSLK